MIGIKYYRKNDFVGKKVWPTNLALFIYVSMNNVKTVKAITHRGFFIYIKLGILSLCTELLNDTKSMRISWYVCLDW